MTGSASRSYLDIEDGWVQRGYTRRGPIANRSGLFAVGEWHRSAACAKPHRRQLDPAGRRIEWLCWRVCQVRRECLLEALRTETRANDGSRWGVFGGLTAAERKAVALEERDLHEIEAKKRWYWGVLS